MTTKMKLEMSKARPKDLMQSKSCNRCCRTRRMWPLSSSLTLTKLCLWLKRTFSDPYQTSRRTLSAWLRLVLIKKKKWIQLGPIFKVFMSSSFNLLSMSLLKCAVLKCTLHLSSYRTSLTCLTLKNQSNATTLKISCTSYMLSWCPAEKWSERLLMNASLPWSTRPTNLMALLNYLISLPVSSQVSLSPFVTNMLSSSKML